MQLERDEREGAGAQRDVGGDVGLGRVFGADDDEAPLEIEELTWVVGAVGVDEEGGAAQRIVGEAEEGPRGEPGEAPLTERDLDPQDGRLAQRCTADTASCAYPRKTTRKALDELVPQLFEGGG